MSVEARQNLDMAKRMLRMQGDLNDANVRIEGLRSKVAKLQVERESHGDVEACCRAMIVALETEVERLREASRPRPMSEAPKDGCAILAETHGGEWADWRWGGTEWVRGELYRRQYISMAGLKHWVPCPGDDET